jgi:hypothetical protein
MLSYPEKVRSTVKPVYKGSRVKGIRKCALYQQVPFIYRIKLYELFMNGKNETVLYRQ